MGWRELHAVSIRAQLGTQLVDTCCPECLQNHKVAMNVEHGRNSKD